MSLCGHLTMASNRKSSSWGQSPVSVTQGWELGCLPPAQELQPGLSWERTRWKPQAASVQGLTASQGVEAPLPSLRVLVASIFS